MAEKRERGPVSRAVRGGLAGAAAFGIPAALGGHAAGRALLRAVAKHPRALRRAVRGTKGPGTPVEVMKLLRKAPAGLASGVGIPAAAVGGTAGAIGGVAGGSKKKKSINKEAAMTKVSALFAEMEGRVMARGFWSEMDKLSAANGGKKSLPPWMKPKNGDDKGKEEAPAKDEGEGEEKKSSLQLYVEKLAEGDYPEGKEMKDKKEAPADDKAARFEAMKEKMKAKAEKK